jgi:hypothetical protein
VLPSADEILQAVGYGLLVPAAVAVVGLLLTLWPGRGEPLGVGAGLAAGFVALAVSGQGDWKFLHPKEAWDWLPALGLLAVVAATVGQVVKWPDLVRWVGRAAVGVLTAALLIRAQSGREPQPLEAYWYAALALAVVALWGILDLAVRRVPGGTVPALLTLTAFAAAVLCELVGFLSLAQSGGVAAAALAGWAVVAWWKPRPGVCLAGVAVLAVLLPAVLFVAWFNKSNAAPPSSFLLMLAAPLSLGATSQLPFGESAWNRTVLLGAVTSAPLAAALVLAARA